jgi:hypothetical protein
MSGAAYLVVPSPILLIAWGFVAFSLVAVTTSAYGVVGQELAEIDLLCTPVEPLRTMASPGSGSLPEQYVSFHGFWPTDPTAENPAPPFSACGMFTYKCLDPVMFKLDEMWVALHCDHFICQPSGYARLAKKAFDLAWSAYLVDMHHNMSFREGHMYQKKKALALALTRAFEKKGDGRVNQIRGLVGPPVLAQVCEKWFSPGPEACEFMPCSQLHAVEENHQDDMSWLEEDETPTHTPTGVPLDGCARGSTLGSDFGLDGIEDLELLDPEAEEIAKDAEPHVGDTPEDAIKCQCDAYRRLYIKQGQRQALKSMSNTMKPLSSLVAWMACKSLNKYTTLRMVVQYAARKPFAYTDVASGVSVEVESYYCSRLVCSNFSKESPDVFQWKQAFLKSSANQEEIDYETQQWKEAILDYLDDKELPTPSHIEFIANTRHKRGNNFLLVFSSVEYAASVRMEEVDLLACECRVTAVVNRRMKLRLDGGLTMPSLFLTAEQASDDAKAMTDHLLDYFVDPSTPYKYICAGSVNVLQERSVRILQLAPWITAEMITTFFSETAGVTPTQVVHDSLYKQKAGLITWVAEFGRNGLDCEDSFKGVAAAMEANNGMFSDPLIGRQVMKLQLLRKRTPGSLTALTKFSSPCALLHAVSRPRGERFC